MKRSQINKLIRELGHDPENVKSIEFRPEEVRVVYAMRAEDDMSMVIREYRHEYEEDQAGKIKLRDLRS